MSLDISTSLAGFNARLVHTVESTLLSDPDRLDEEAQQLWTSSTITWPRLFKAEECWVDSAPSTTKLILDTLDVINAAKTAPSDKTSAIEFSVKRRGEQDLKIDPRMAITQLIEPRQFSPVTIMGLPILDSGTLVPPSEISEFADPCDVSSDQMLLTPKFSYTNLYLGKRSTRFLALGRNSDWPYRHS